MADEDTWWEVQAQLVVLASILLGMFPVTDERHEAPMRVLTKLFTTKTTSVFRKRLITFSQCSQDPPSVLKVFVDVF